MGFSGDNERVTCSTATQRFMAAMAVVACVVVGVVVGSATPAVAHSQLVETSPLSGEQLDQAPDTIALRFNEPITVGLGGIELFDSNGDRVEVGAPTNSPGDSASVFVDIPTVLLRGSYAVSYSVVSADGHPVRGAFTFTIITGDVVAAENVASRELAASGGSPSVGVALGMARGVGYAGMALAFGALTLFMLGAPDLRRRSRIAGLVGASIGVAASLAQLSLQGPYVSGRPLGDMFNSALFDQVLGTQLGDALVLRTGFLLALALLFAVLRRDVLDVERPPLGVALCGGVLALASAVATAWAGHAGSGNHVTLAMVATTLHVLAMGTWLGGLVLLVFFMFRTLLSEDEAIQLLRRFSKVALVSVTVLVVSGATLSWRQVGSIEALRNTTYGSLLIAKLFAVLVAIGIAGLVRRRVHASSSEGSVGERRTVKRLMSIEVVFVLVALSITTVLATTVPARDALVEPVSVRLQLSDQRYADFTIDPPRSGVPTEVHVYVYGTTGALEAVQDIAVTASEPSRGLAGIGLPMTLVATGHAQSLGAVVPFPGTWTFTVSVLVDEFLIEEISTTARIG